MRRILIITPASLAALAGVAFATGKLPPPGEQADFTLSVNPARQGAVRGGAASFRVSVARAGGFTGAIRLRVAGLPEGVRARWRLADGTSGAVVPLSETGAVLTLRTSARTPLGLRRVKVLATGGATTRARGLTLTVAQRGSPGFSLRISPRRQIMAQGASATYAVRVARAGGFRGRVTLRARALPRGAGATWTPSALTVSTSADQSLGSDRFVVEGTGQVGRDAVRRYAVAVLTVAETRPFTIDGDLTTLLYPGASAPLDLVLTNPHPFDIRVTALSVSVGADTTNPHCNGPANYAVSQYSGGYPLVLAPGGTRLSMLAPSRARPQVGMYSLPTNQDACKGALVSLDYSGQATR